MVYQHDYYIFRYVQIDHYTSYKYKLYGGDDNYYMILSDELFNNPKINEYIKLCKCHVMIMILKQLLIKI